MSATEPTQNHDGTDPISAVALTVTHHQEPTLQVASNTTDGFTAFYERHYPNVARALSLTLGNSALGAEAADEAMVRTYQRWSTVCTYASPAGWAYRVGLNWSRSLLRRRKRGLNPLYRPDVTQLNTVVDIDLQAALGSLSVDHRSVVVCRYLFDWSVEQTADALQIRPGTVKSRLNRALENLNTQLASPSASLGASDAT